MQLEIRSSISSRRNGRSINTLQQTAPELAFLCSRAAPNFDVGEIQRNQIFAKEMSS